MRVTCIAVVDATRARLFVHTRNFDGTLHENLAESRDLVNPQRRLRPSELFSDSRPSRNAQGTVDDHRDRHIVEYDREFAAEVAREISALVKDSGAGRVVLCAPPHMLGMLRRQLRGVQVDDIPRDFTKLTPSQLRNQLVAHALLPAA